MLSSTRFLILVTLACATWITIWDRALASNGSVKGSLPQTISEAPRWCEAATDNLTRLDGAAFQCDGHVSRCIKLNNYSCTKNFSSLPYEGQMQTAAGRPINDIDYHAVYSDPKYSLAETIHLLAHYYLKLQRTNALLIAERYAPWCDTNGSKLTHLGWGRTCHDGISVNASFKGPRCEQPANGIPAKGQCGPCNCPNKLAQFYVEDSGQKVTDTLGLFDAGGKPTPALSPMLRRVVTMELGYRPKVGMITGAVEAYKPK